MFFIVLLLGLALGGPLSAQTADWLLKNANVYTLDEAMPKTTAIAVQGNKIVALGNQAERLQTAKTRVVDVHGATVVPGLIDSHGHMRGLGGLLESADLRSVSSIAEIAAYVRQQAALHKPGEWIIGRNWDQTNWGGRFPTATDIDAAAPENPVYLTRVDGHAGWANHRALELAGITDTTPDPPGGRIVRDEQHHAAGVLVDAAQSLVRKKIPPPTQEQIRRQLALAAKECARLGLTTVHDAGVSAEDLAAYRSLIASDELPVRIYAMIGGEGSLWKTCLQRGPEISDRLTVRAIKLYADGALGSRGAALWQPYTDDKSNSGLLLTDAASLERVSRAAVEHGFQVCTHAIGDKANRMVLDAYAKALGGKNDHRFRVEHAQVISLPDFQMFADHSVIASIQSTHATSDMRWAAQRLGPDRLTGAYAWQRFLKLGIPVANGSDFPVEQPNPMLGFYAAFARADLQGNPPGGWMPDQRMTREQALRSFTLTGAYAAFEEKIKGSITPGKLADFVVLDRDIMTVDPLAVPQTKVRMTVLGGRVVYEAK